MLYDTIICLNLSNSDMINSERERFDEVRRIERGIRLDSYYKGVSGNNTLLKSYVVSFKGIDKKGLMQILSEFSNLESFNYIKIERAK